MNNLLKALVFACVTVVGMAIFLFLIYCGIILLLFAYESGGYYAAGAVIALFIVIVLTIQFYTEIT